MRSPGRRVRAGRAEYGCSPSLTPGLFRTPLLIEREVGLPAFVPLFRRAAVVKMLREVKVEGDGGLPCVVLLNDDPPRVLEARRAITGVLVHQRQDVIHIQGILKAQRSLLRRAVEDGINDQTWLEETARRIDRRQ